MGGGGRVVCGVGEVGCPGVGRRSLGPLLASRGVGGAAWLSEVLLLSCGASLRNPIVTIVAWGEVGRAPRQVIKPCAPTAPIPCPA